MDPKFSKFEAEVARLLKANIAIKNISILLSKPPKAIRDAIYRFKKKKNQKRKLERVSRGGVSKLSERDKRSINRDLTRSPKKTNRRLLVENDVNISTRTLQRFLKREGYSINIAKKKSILNKEKAKNRLKYAKDMLKNLSNIRLDRIIFSDESAIQRGRGYRGEYVRKRQNKRQGREQVSTANRCKLKKILIG